jgi:hypothetical protein
VLQGLYGAATMVGGGLAIAIVPAMTDATSWRAPYVSALVLALVAVVPVLGVRRLPLVGRSERGVLRDRQLLPLGVLQAASFGLVVVAGNWVVPLLERRDASSGVAGALGALVLLAGIVTRPLGGALLADPAHRRLIVGGCLIAVAGGAAILASGGPIWLSGAGALVLAAGAPFSSVFQATQRLRADAPGAAIAFVNGCAVLTILVGTPLAGLAFGLPGDGAFAFAAIGVLALAALVALPRTSL